MDVVKTKKQTTWFGIKVTKKWVIISASLLATVFLIIYAKSTLNNVSIKRQSILFSTVKMGDKQVVVDGYGKLTSDKLQLLTTLTNATVAEIRLKPGAIVRKDSVIAVLANPKLQQELENAEQELALEKANMRQLAVNHTREVLDEEGRKAELTALYQAAKLKRQAEQSLAKDGIISDLDFKQTLLHEEQLRQRMDILERRMTQLALVHKEATNIANERIKQKNGRLNIAKNRLASLHVKAGIDGVLQRLSIQLGQSLSAGQELALIGSVTDLIALVRVPQSQVSLISIGQKATVDTRQGIIDGQVVRIDPIVAQNTVEIEIAFQGEIPISARPEQNVDARIIIKTLNNILYIDRPANATAHSQTRLYKVSADTRSAMKAPVTFGEKSGRYIQLLGASVGDRYIVSDMNNYKAEVLTIN